MAVPSAGGLITGTYSNCDTTRTTGIHTGSSNSITGAPGSSSDRSTNSLLVVLANGDRVTQIYSNYTTTNGTAGRMWIRTSNSSSAWGDWKEIGGGGSGSQGP
ncbi:MAG: pyocin knob domain-containing protein, partial [Candidatus Fibromonas sp.]|nr:pyocin knob domain-containing protein [Candidatus Fibromonas sp.]